MSEVQTKYFTPAEAKKTLPLVKKIVFDILNTVYNIRLISESVEGEIENDPEINKHISEIEGFLKELEEIGCSYKDWNYKIGLVDFPSVIDGEDVLLCWRSDEEDILFYHGIDEGYHGRKPIPEEYLF